LVVIFAAALVGCGGGLVQADHLEMVTPWLAEAI